MFAFEYGSFVQMNDAIALSQQWGIANAGVALALPGSKTAKTVAREIPSASEIMTRVYAALENLVLITIEKRSGAEFQEVRKTLFGTYSNAALALAPLANIVFPPHALDRMARESFCELEADIRDKALGSFGEAVRDQAIFTAWTFRKIYDIVTQISAIKTIDIDAATATQLMALVQEFSLYTLWTRFHLHCLMAAMRTQKPLFPEPLDLIVDGLRSAVNAYALIRRILDIVIPQPIPAVESVIWDDEDADLLAEANLDLQSEMV
jgi:hypothetical protein